LNKNQLNEGNLVKDCEHRKSKQISNIKDNHFWPLIKKEILKMRKKNNKFVTSFETEIYKSFSEIIDSMNEIKAFQKKRAEELKNFLYDYDEVIAEIDLNSNNEKAEEFVENQQRVQILLQKSTTVLQNLKQKNFLIDEEKKQIMHQTKLKNENIKNFIQQMLDDYKTSGNYKSNTNSKISDNINSANITNK
jgi:hypothetical protein